MSSIAFVRRQVAETVRATPKSDAGLISRRQHARNLVACLLVFAAGFVLQSTTHGASSSVQRTQFIEKYCAECHDDLAFKADLDLLHQPFIPTNASNFEIWATVHDRVQAGEMPPKNKPRPAASDQAAFLKSLSADLVKAEEAAIRPSGRAMKRRLNRYEYEATLRDLLNVPWIQVKDRLPEDGEKYRFNKIGEALDVSYVQLSRYMTIADYAVRQAMSAQLEQPAPATNRYFAREEFSLTGNFRPRENGTLPDRLSFPVLDAHAQPDVRAGRAPITTPETREREAVGRVSSIFSDAGGYSWSQFRAPAAGRYHLRFKGYTIWVSGGGVGRWFYEGFGEEKAPLFYLPLWHRPNLDEVWPGRRDEPIGIYASSAGQNRPVGAIDFKIEPSTQDVTVLLAAGEQIRTDGMRLFRTRVNGSDEQYVNPLAQPDGMPGYAVQWMEVQGPFSDGSQGEGYRRLFGDLPLQRVAEGKEGAAIEIVPPAQPALGRQTNAPARGVGPGPGRGPRGGGRGGNPGGIRTANV